MARAVTAYSSSNITKKSLQKVMDYLKAGPDPHGWELSRNGRRVFIEISTDGLDDMPEDLLRPVAELLKAWPRSSVVLMYNDNDPDEFEARMARAAAMAMAELWPIVFDDHTGEPELVYPPGKRPPEA